MTKTVEADFHARTQEFALRIIKLYSSLPKGTVAQVLGKQLLRCGTSVGAHYAEASHAKSIPDFVSKCDGARQELQEFLYWLELIVRSELVKPDRVQPLEHEARQILAILITMSSNAKKKLKQ
jgi:four helix bundle protein